MSRPHMIAGVVLIAALSLVTPASAFTQKIDSNPLTAVSCISSTTDCVVSDSKGKALYATKVSMSSEATWSAWSEPASPSDALACPESALCVLGDGESELEGEGPHGDNLYYAGSLGGAWTSAKSGRVLAISCPSASFCVNTEVNGTIRYSTKPGSGPWTKLEIGSGAMNGVSCLSSAFCAVVNSTGDLYVATTEKHITEATGWKFKDIDGSTVLHGVACTSTSSCVAVDGAGTVINLSISTEGTATASTQDIDGTNELTAVTCAATTTTCVAVDDRGEIFASTNAGTSWSERYAVTNKLTSVSCASSSLCVAADEGGNVSSFDPATPPSYTQTIDSGNSVNAVSCIPNSADCVVSDSKGRAYYATNVSTSAKGTWTTWNGPTGQSPSEAVGCLTTTLCVLADGGAEEGGGGDMYYASSLGGSWKEAFSPLYGAVAVSCGSSTLCVAGQSEGFIHYTSKPASGEWFALSIGSGTMNAVDCFSASFCAVVDSSGHVRIANTEAHIKEAAGWKPTDIDGATELHGVACVSTTSCVAVDGTGDVVNLTIESSGTATASTQDIDGTNSFTAVSCTGSATCAAVDSAGNIFVSNNEGETWVRQHQLTDKLTSVSCASSSLCLAADTTGEVTAFDTR